MKIKKPLLLFICFIATQIINSQTPTFQWAQNIGGVNGGRGNSVGVDASGNVYTAGYFYGTFDFDPGAGTFTLTSAGGGDIFVSKLDAAGNFVWAKSMGSASTDFGTSLAIDANGNILTTGYFNGTVDFDPGAATFTLASAGSTDIFISKLDPAGNFIWAKSIGGTSFDAAAAISLDASGNVYTTGYFYTTVDFDPGAGTFTLTSNGSADIFVSKLDASGNFVWAKNMGGTSDEQGYSIAVDATGNVYTCGTFLANADFDPSAGTFTITCLGQEDTFISKLDASGNFVWAQSTGGVLIDNAFGIAVNGSGVYVTGNFEGTADFDPSAATFNLTSAGNYDTYILKLGSAGNFVWVKQLLGASYDGGQAIKLDASGNIYATGFYHVTTDFDPGAGTFNMTSNGNEDIFVLKLDPNGTFLWAQSMGGTITDVGNSIDIDAAGKVYTTGYFYGTADFDPSATTYNLTSAGLSAVFVHKIGQITVGIKENTMQNNIQAYPNPNSGSFKLRIDNEIINGEIILTNAIGQKVYGQKISEGENNITIENLAKGFYSYTVFRNKEQIGTGKLMIE